MVKSTAGRAKAKVGVDVDTIFENTSEDVKRMASGTDSYKRSQFRRFQAELGDIEKLPKVISLYGGTRKPSAEMLEGVNLIIYDIQDIGARFYTYISTLGLVMETGAELGIPILVLDRPNPIRGDIIEGPILDLAYKSFVGHYPIPTRYGGTVGELAIEILKNKWIASLPELEIIKMEG